MLKIHHKSKLVGKTIQIRIGNIREYYVEGIYYFNDMYQINLRSNDRLVMDEIMILERKPSGISVIGPNNEENCYRLYNWHIDTQDIKISKSRIGDMNGLLSAVEYLITLNK